MKRIRPKEKETTLGDWRHAIFKRVVSPVKTSSASLNTSSKTQKEYNEAKVLDTKGPRTKRSKEEIRKLWKNAIFQQIQLNRMDKQNYILKAQQEEALGKRVKLSYATLGICDDEASDTWDLIIAKAQKSPGTVCDLQLLDSAIFRGIPKHKRGQVWQFFMQQRNCMTKSSSGTRFCPKADISYQQLRKQLTSHQHAILIDLGRTFPSHPFFCDPLGTGQLALFNLLKAYSILDPDVGYCQGLSFVAGILLMHYEEEEAFSMLKYFMFELGAREHYKPEMDGLQVKLYQLTRMIHDQDPELHLFLDQEDVLPTLYAAPWFLTMFAAHFSIGFAVRVFDIVFLYGIDMITKFAVAIIVDHKNDLMKCSGLEQVMECFRNVVTKIGSDNVNRYLKKVLESDSDNQLVTYAAEYSVMHNESFLTFINNGYSSTEPSEAIAKQPEKASQVTPTPMCEGCRRLRTDIITLLKYVETLQDILKDDEKHKWTDYPQQISALMTKYGSLRCCGDGSIIDNVDGVVRLEVTNVPSPLMYLKSASEPRNSETDSSTEELSQKSSPSSINSRNGNREEDEVRDSEIAQKFVVF